MENFNSWATGNLGKLKRGTQKCRKDMKTGNSGTVEKFGGSRELQQIMISRNRVLRPRWSRSISGEIEWVPG